MYSSPAILINTVDFEILKLLNYVYLVGVLRQFMVSWTFSGEVTILSNSTKILLQFLPVDKYQLFQNGLELQHSAGRKDHFYSLI